MAPKHTPRTEYSAATKNYFIGAVLSGRVCVREAGRMFGINKSSAHRIWNRYKERGTVENLPRSGRPPKSDEITPRLRPQTARNRRRRMAQSKPSNKIRAHNKVR
ncbi:hypothetical protein CPC08DRAFT_149078 [Agrocybe pediades]|nr:hypothetical protein CPC08DRAFT_149078 [Agrocybe pediades]